MLHACGVFSTLEVLSASVLMKGPTDVGFLGPMLMAIIESKKIPTSDLYQLILYIYNIR